MALITSKHIDVLWENFEYQSIFYQYIFNNVFINNVIFFRFLTHINWIGYIYKSQTAFLKITLRN